MGLGIMAIPLLPKLNRLPIGLPEGAVGIMSAIGRVTVVALDLNRERVIAIRQADLDVGRHPPGGDRMED
jgi:hypothetical protein